MNCSRGKKRAARCVGERRNWTVDKRPSKGEGRLFVAYDFFMDNVD